MYESLLAIASLGCTGATSKSDSTSDSGPGSVDSAPTPTATSSYTLTYGLTGYACVTSEGVPGDTVVMVDFDACHLCSEVDATCSATLSGSTITVVGTAEVTIQPGCSTYGTCEPVIAQCAGPDLAAGTYDLVYASATTAGPVVVPTLGQWACTM